MLKKTNKQFYVLLKPKLQKKKKVLCFHTSFMIPVFRKLAKSVSMVLHNYALE